MNTNVPQPARRGFLKETAAIVLGTLSGLIPFAAGLAVFLDPLRKKSQSSSLSFVATLDALPEDGSPRQFNVIADRSDAWNRTPNVPIGAVYLRRSGEQKVQALNVVCPHAGCFVDYKAQEKCYLCPCHQSKFALDGTIEDPKSPTPRALDTLEVEIRNESEVWVRYESYLAGRPEKVRIA